MKKISYLIGLFMLLVLLGTNPQVSQAANKNAEITISSDPSGSSYGTHAFITIKNISKKTIKVGKMDVKANKQITVGTWGNKDEHKGIFYNLEAYFVNSGSKAYNKRVSLSKKITSKQLSKISSTISTYNNKWSYKSNCSTFAAAAWNSVNTKSNQLNPGTGLDTPKKLAKAIKKKKGYLTADKTKINKIEKKDVIFYKNNKKNKASSKSFKSHSSN